MFATIFIESNKNSTEKQYLFFLNAKNLILNSKFEKKKKKS